MLTLSALFTRRTSPEPLPLEEEVALVERVKNGDAAAFNTLAETYAPRLRAASAHMRHAIVDEDERTQAVVVAFLEAVHATEPGVRVANRVKFTMAEHMQRAASAVRPGLSVPQATFMRYFAALRDGGLTPAGRPDYAAASERASSHGLTSSAFHEVRDAIREPESIEALAAAGSAGTDRGLIDNALQYEETIERKAMVDKARKAVSGDERTVVDLAYGFAEFDVIPDAEIAHRLGMNRSTVWRKKAAALDKMRNALGVEA
ncbi:sigma-70 family RNA polymerase sigma factor [Cellulosimicrobium sp. TH-20]|uniref:sigma-70 family RNA polymerase sigma factor n=1 Tax=Cellulosimicrobium sp. TH-20 TaxID=1980001 RepID=UPI0011A152D6|nr:sigma-70 family RNA polymerase sigma factor [Cellulosimicrobium sp. TH-20]